MGKRRLLKRTVPRILLALMLVGSTIPEVRFVAFVTANPIPIPTLSMPEEYINATLSVVDGKLFARVDGIYPFHNVNYTTVRMDYPAPPDATNISVKMNETSLEWTYDNATYPTVIGDWPMINWTISSLPNFAYFTIETSYEHHIPITNGTRTFLYAMGTGRFLKTYAKQTTAYVNIRMETNYTDLDVYTIGYVNGAWTWKPANYTVIQEDTTEIITLNVTSSMFNPLIEDLMLTFSMKPASPDINEDGTVNMDDLVATLNAFGTYPTHPRWNPIADVNGDGKADMGDIIIILANFGKHYP